MAGYPSLIEAPRLGEASPRRGVVPLVDQFRKGHSIPAEIAQRRFGRVESGLLALVERGPRGDRAVVEVAGPGATIGEFTLINRRPYGPNQSFEALVPTRVTWLAPAAPTRGLPDDPEVMLAIMGVVAARTRLANDVAHRHQMQSAAQRVAHHLVEFAEVDPLSRGALPTCRISRSDLGRVVQCRRETVSDICRSFEQRGWIRADRDLFQLLSPQSLAALASVGIRTEIPPIRQRLLTRQAELWDLVAQRS